MQIAIDGPASAGKSTIAKMIADRLGILLLDTGAMYRALTLLAMQSGLDLGSAVESDIESLFVKFALEFEGEKVLLNGDDVTGEIRTPEVDRHVSRVSSFPKVRNKMVALQREIASNRAVVMEGRDIGTVVLRDTPYKFFLDAAVDVRAKRRWEQNQERGINLDLETVKSQMQERDCQDRNKEAGKLHVANGSLVIDTTNLSTDDIVKIILANIG